MEIVRVNSPGQLKCIVKNLAVIKLWTSTGRTTFILREREGGREREREREREGGGECQFLHIRFLTYYVFIVREPSLNTRF